MPLAVAYSRAQSGVDAPLVTVEVHLSNGLPHLSIVGLPETAVKESKDRVRGALLNSRFQFPPRRITINLAPADLPKEGGRFDLPIALGVLAASGQLPKDRLSAYEFLGELALGGALRGIRGVLPATLQARDAARTLVVPEENADEAALVSGITVLSARHLREVCAHLTGETELPRHPPLDRDTHSFDDAKDLADVRGQHHAKRALEIAAAGSHSLLMLGPPGTGKTMLASRLPGILPPMSEREALETAAIASVSTGGFSIRKWRIRPFRAPHHTASGVALVGGGSHPRPGEVSLAHNGVLFLDELPEFDRRVLEVLREPLESGHITISRAARQAEFPACFQLVAAMNPTFSGYTADSSEFSQQQARRYQSRVSGPLLDRIDIHLEVPPVPRSALRAGADNQAETSAQVRARVAEARRLQMERAGKPNAALSSREVETWCRIGDAEHRLLEQATERLGLSARAYHRILKVARTIADLAGGGPIGAAQLAEAISYRRLDRMHAER